jgi:hypothetical protein
MPEATNPPGGPPGTGATRLRRIWHSPTGTAAAMVLFLVVSALWLVAAGTARTPDFSQPPCLRPCMPQFPSAGNVRVWIWLGITGAVLIVASLVLLARGGVGLRREVGTARLVSRAAAAGLAGILAEVVVILVVTHVAIVMAPLGAENSGEIGAAIAVLGVLQLPLAVGLAVAWRRLRIVGAGESEPATHRFSPVRAILGLGGMVLSCAAFAVWSLRNGPPGVVINAQLIAGTPHLVNVGAWWPGLFAAMVALILLAAASAPGVTSRAVRRVPRAPSASDSAASPGWRRNSMVRSASAGEHGSGGE